MPTDPCLGHRGPFNSGGTAWENWGAPPNAFSQFIAPCDADTPVTATGGCEDDPTPCVVCSTPGDNGGAL